MSKQKYHMPYQDLKFGVFLAASPTNDGNPANALENELQCVQFLDESGYEYVWIAEGRSPGSWSITSAEDFISKAASRTKNIHFGVYMASGHFQHPLKLADRIVQISQMAEGRVTFCIGPDAHPSGSAITERKSTVQQNDVFKNIDVLLPLLQGKAIIKKTSLSKSAEAKLESARHLNNMVELNVASQISPAAARTAGIHGLGLLSIGATSAGGFDTLATNWEIGERAAKINNQKVHRKNWSLLGPVHIAESKEQAFENVKFGLDAWLAYFREVAGISIVPLDAQDPASSMVESGLAVIGTPGDAVAQIRRLQEQSGGFGTFLQMAHNWADGQHTRKSIELFARYVIPEFQSNRDTIKA